MMLIKGGKKMKKKTAGKGLLISMIMGFLGFIIPGFILASVKQQPSSLDTILLGICVLITIASIISSITFIILFFISKN